MKLFLTGPRFLGVRPGLILGPGDFPGSGKVEGAFLYAIGNQQGLVKVGVTTNPRQRLATLQTAYPFPLQLLGLWATPGDGYDIEERAHSLLDHYRMRGEWFRVGTTTALASIEHAASTLSRPLLKVSLEQSDQILVAATSQTPGRNWFRIIVATLAALSGLAWIFRI